MISQGKAYSQQCASTESLGARVWRKGHRANNNAITNNATITYITKI